MVVQYIKKRGYPQVITSLQKLLVLSGEEVVCDEFICCLVDF